MYIPEHFVLSARDEMHAFVRSHPFGQLISIQAERPFCSHLPFLLDDEGRLITHLAKANSQWQTIAAQEVLVSFIGPHAYISPTWYSSPGVPTWNYQAVHVYGKARLVTETEALARIVAAMTREQEKALEKPWSMVYRDGLLEAIVGIEIEPSEWQGKSKLGQNRGAEDCQQVAAFLRQQGETEMAEVMCRANSVAEGC